MASTNISSSKVPMRERELTAKEKLMRTISSCLLWEDNFYEDGVSVAERISSYIKDINREDFLEVLHWAKVENKLRHAPLYLILEASKYGLVTKEDVYNTITRVDDMMELLSLHWRDKAHKPIPACIKKGIKEAFKKFDEYQFGKYKLDKKAVKLKDVVLMTRPKPENEERSALYKRILENTLATPNTWEVELSQSKDKNASWTSLLKEKRLGALALIRNLRNMEEANVDRSLIKDTLSEAALQKLLPFQIMQAALINPDYNAILEVKLLECTKDFKKLKGTTLVMLDKSGSMSHLVSSRSNLTCWGVAKTVAIVLNEVCENILLYTFNYTPEKVTPYKGFALSETLGNYTIGGTNVYGSIMKAYNAENPKTHIDRVIIITDEQDTYQDKEACKQMSTQIKKGYVVNIANYEKGVTYLPDSHWTTISGFSENVIKYITEVDNN